MPSAKEATKLTPAHRGGVGAQAGPGTGVAEQHVVEVAEGAGRWIEGSALDLVRVRVMGLGLLFGLGEEGRCRGDGSRDAHSTWLGLGLGIGSRFGEM